MEVNGKKHKENNFNATLKLGNNSTHQTTGAVLCG